MAILIVGVATTAMRAQSAQIGSNIDGSAANDNLGYSLAMSKDGNRIAIGSPGANVGTSSASSSTNPGNVKIYDWNASNSTWDLVGDSIVGEAAGDQFGVSVDLSGSGDTLAVGAHYNDGTATDAGHVRIYAWNGTNWTQLGSDIDGGREEDYLGTSVALTPDGNRVVVGAIQGLGNTRGGYVRTLDWDADTNTWIPQDTVRGRGNLIDSRNRNSSSYFGRSVALSDDGNRLIIGANGFGHDIRSSTSGLQTDVYVYDWEENRGQWTDEPFIQPRGDVPFSSSSYVGYGTSVDVSADGNRWAVSNPIFGDRDRPWLLSFIDVFDRNEGNTGWKQSGGSIRGAGIYQEYFGWDLQLSADGNLLAAGSPRRAVSRRDSRSEAEDTYVYEWSSFNNTWIRTEILRGEGVGNREGISLALSDDGSRLAIGADMYGRNGTNTGRVRVFDNLNRLPFLELSTSNIAPSTPNETDIPVANLTITDPNPNETHTLAISGTDANQFRFNDDTTQLLTSNAFNLKAIDNTYSFTLTITDRAGAVHPQPIVLTVEDVPIPPIDIQLSKDSIIEGEPIGTFIGTLSATDHNGNISGYAIEGTSPFEIVGDTLRSSEVFEFSTQNSHTVTITVTDSTGLAYSETFTIRILSATPTDIALSDTSIVEGEPIGTTIGTLTTTDSNGDDQVTYTYSLFPEESRDNFQIVGNELQSRISFDYERGPRSYVLTLRTTDSTGLYFEKTFTINIRSAAPTDITLNDNSIFERQPIGTTIGTLTTTDPNNHSQDAYTYSLPPEASRDNFQIVGNELQSRISFDYESDPRSYELTLRTTDSTGLYFEKTFTINIRSATPTDLALSSTSLLENAPIGTAIGTLTTTDPNNHSQNAYTYSLLPETSRDIFQIVDRTLRNRISFDYEIDPRSYELTLITTDPTGLYFEKTFTLTITDDATITDPPVAPFAYGTAHRNDSINENYTGFIGIRSPLTFLETNTMEYSIIVDTLVVPEEFKDFFTYRGDSLFLLDALDYEMPTHEDIPIRMRLAHNSSSGTAEDIFTTVTTLRLRNVNEHPPTNLRWARRATVGDSIRYDEPVNGRTSSSPSGGVPLTENTPVRSKVRFSFSPYEPYYLTVEDRDRDPQNTFFISDGNEDGFFEICGENKNQICVAQPLDLANSVPVGIAGVTVFQSTFRLRFSVTDGDTTIEHTALFEIVVTDIPESPRDLMLTADSISENSPSNSVIGILSNADNDPGDVHVYTITSGNDSSFFVTVEDTLKVTQPLNYESDSTYELTITARDRAGNTGSGTFTIRVLDLRPEPPVELKLSTDSIIENNPPNALVGIISHEGDQATYAITRNVMKDGENLFAIAGDSLKVTQSLDYENDPTSYTVTITATTTDANQNTGSEMLTLRLIDEPEIALSEQNIRTNNNIIPAHTLVGTITHPVQGNNLSLTLTGTDLLTLVKDSLRVAEDVDVSQGGKSFKIVLSVNDQDGNTLDMETFLITLTKNRYNNTHQILLGDSSNEQQGKAVALSASGRRMVIGTDEYDNSRGRVRVMEQDPITSAWTRMGDYLTGRNSSDRFGGAVDINPEGNRIAIAAKSARVEANRPGVVYIYQWEGNQWTLLGDSLAGNTNRGNFGADIVLTNEGNLLIVGEPDNDGGRVHIYEWQNNSTWTRLQTLNDNNNDNFMGSLGGNPIDPFEKFGFSVTASANADRIVVGIPAAEKSSNGGSHINTGIAFFYHRSGENTTWSKAQSLVVSENAVTSAENLNNQYGHGVAMSLDGNRLAIGAPFRDNRGNGTENGVIDIYEWRSDRWGKVHTRMGANRNKMGQRNTFEFSPDGTRLAIGIPEYDNKAGRVIIYQVEDLRMLLDEEGSSADQLGTAVDLNNNGRIIAGGSGLDDNGNSNVGGVRVYEVSLAPTLTFFNEDLSLSEDLPIGTLIDSLYITDPDPLDNTFVLTLSGEGSEDFIAENQQLRVNQILNFSRRSTYTLNLTIDDGRGVITNIDNFITINVRNVNDIPTNITITSDTINENQPIETPIGVLSTTDRDAGDTHTYTLSGTDSSFFNITNDNELRFRTRVPDFETQQTTYSLVITTDDGNGGTFDTTFTLTVIDLPEAPANITLTNNIIDENSPEGTTIGTFRAEDEDNNETLRFSFVDNSSITQFQIVDDSLLQTTADSLNFEADPTHTLTIIVTDKDNLMDTMDFVITVQDINEPPTDIGIRGDRIDENIHDVFSVLSTTDPDTSDTHTYTLGGTDSSFFNINGRLLRFNTPPDFENPDHDSTYVLTITTTDNNGETFSKDFSIIVVDMNEPPTNITLTSHTIDENSPEGTTIGILRAEDPDNNETRQFFFVNSDNIRQFRITDDSLLQTTSTSLNYEEDSTFTLNIYVADKYGLSDTMDLVINVQNVNEVPTALSFVHDDNDDNTIVVDENSPVGTFISTLTTTDPDIGDTHNYALGNEADANAFRISNDSLLVNQLFNFEASPTKRSYSFTLTTTDLGGLSITSEQLIISINNVNEAPTGFTISNNPASISENLRGAAIATFSNVQDPDAGDAHTFSIAEDNVPFDIVGTELRTHSVDSIDYETQAQYTLTIIVTDQGNLTFQEKEELIVNIGNVNDEDPTDITLSSNSISENSPANTLIGTFTSIDPDDEGTPTDNYVYSLTDSDATHFSINANQLFSNTANFDFETKATYEITITSEDDNGGTFMKDFTINVTDSNDPPTGITLSSDVVRRDAPIGTVIGNLSATDQDNRDSHTFTLTAGDQFFEIPANTNTLQTKVSLQESTYSISVTADDGNGGTFSQDFTIMALDFVVMLSNNSVAENEPVGTTIGVLSSSDDANDAARTFTLDVPSMTNFAIVGNTLTSKVIFNYEEGNNTQPISITTTNDIGEDYPQTFMINITNVNETPTEMMLSNNAVNENSPIGTNIGTLTTMDPDAGDTHTYSLTTSNDTFQIVGDTLKTNRSLDFETKSSYTISITTTDGDGSTFDTTFTINVQNVNEVPTALSFVHDDNDDNTIVVDENSPVGTLVSTLTTTDPDIGDTHNYALGNEADASAFRISNDSLLVNQLFNFEASPTKRSYFFTLTTTDLGGLSIMSEQLIISINNVNEAPTGFTISGNPANINENRRGVSVVTFSSVQDPDAGDAHTFSIAEENVPFDIVGTELRTHSVDSIDYETQAQYTLTIIVTDQGNLTFQQELIVNIGNLNDENPTDITLSSSTISENLPAGTLIGTLTTIDPDDGGTPTTNYRYTLTGSDAARFRIMNTNELVSRTANFDFETKATYDITIASGDRNGGTFMKDFTINVTDSNDPPTDIALSSNVVRRDALIGTVIGNLTATDPDNSDSHSFSLTSDIFQIVGDTLKTKALLQQDIYSISVTTDDGNGETFDKVFTINALDFVIMLSENTLAENQPIGTTIGVLSTSDDTGDAARTFTLDDPSMTNFDIVGNTLTSKVIFNYEEGNNTQSISITTTNDAGGNYSQTFMINIMNVNEAPTEIMLSNNAIDENSPIGTNIGTLTTMDPDAGDMHTYSLTTPNDTFLIVEDTLKTNRNIDFETKSTYTLSITSTDGGGSTFDTTFTISINDLNEHVNSVPTDITLSNNNIDEDAPIGTTIGTLTTTDLDSGDTHTYTLTTPNDTFQIKGNILKTNRAFDFETKSSYSLSITTTDSSGGNFSKTFTITINDVEENTNSDPTDITLSSNTVDENSPVGTEIGRLFTVDPDAGDTHTYTLTTPNDAFQIVEDTLKTNSVLDFETKSSYSLSITTTDNSGGSFDKEFTITINDVEEDGALSINEVDHLVQVLPVFVKDKCALIIEHPFIGKVVVNMYTLNGTTAKTLVYNKNLRNMSKNIPVTLLPSGVYIVKIQFGKFVALKKIVKH